MAITRYAGDRFVIGSSPDVEPTGVLDGAFLINTGNLSQKVLRNGTWTTLAGGGGGGSTDPAGSNTQVQFNNNGVFGATTGLTFDGQRLYANNFQLSGILYDSNASVGEGGMVLANEGTTGVHWKNIESVLSGVGGSGVANYVARWSDEDTLTTGALVDNGTKVGIGTTDPEEILHLESAGAVTPGLLHDLYSTTASRFPYLGLRKSASNTAGTLAATTNEEILGKIVFKGVDSGSSYFRESASIAALGDGAPDADTQPGKLYFSTSNTSSNQVRMTIKNDGNVGIGTTAPGYRFEVRESSATWISRIYNTGTGNGLLVRVDSGSSDAILSTHNGTNHILVVKGDEKVGIGTYTPQRLLHIYGASDVARFQGTGTNYIDIDGNGTQFSCTTNLSFRAAVSGGAMMTIKTDGNVGIGYNSPTAPVHISRPTQTAGTQVDILNLYTNALNALNGEAWINIGSSSSTNLPGRPYVRIGANKRDSGADQATAMTFWTRENAVDEITERMRIDPAGNVGIGDNLVDPQHRLHVSGDAIISGVLYDSTNSSGASGYVLTSEVGGPQWQMIEDVLSGVGGNGTANYVPKWEDSDTIGNSIIYDNGSNIGIGNAVPSGTLDIVGSNGTVDVAADGDAQELVIRNNDRAGIQILSSETDMSSVVFGSAADANGANIFYGPTSKLLTIGSQVAAGQVAFRAANGVEAVRIDAAGKVGIGITNPDQKLSVAGNIQARSGGWFIARSADNAGYSYLKNPTTSGSAIAFHTSGEKMRLLSNGNVGIGVTDPAAPLEVRHASGGMIRMSSGDASNSEEQVIGGLEWYNHDASGDGPQVSSAIKALAQGSGARSDLVFYAKDAGGEGVYAGEAMRINGQSGYLGINVGTVEPSNQLTIESGTTGESISDGLRLQNSHGVNNDISPIYFGVHGGTRRAKCGIGWKRTGSYGIGKLLFALDNTGDDADVSFANDTKVTFQGDGKVGIGTDAPSGPLHIATDSSAAWTDGSTSTLVGDLIITNADDTNNNFSSLVFGSKANVEIYTGARITARYPDHAGANPSAELFFETKNDDGYLYAKMCIDRDGKVGIGTTAPGATLTLSDGTDNFDFDVTENALTIKTTTADAADDQAILIDAGNGGLSSTRGAYIHLHGNEHSLSAGNAIYQCGNLSTSAHLFRKGGGIDAAIITSDGNVGIGQNFITPQHKLHVSGDAIISGVLYDSTNSSGAAGHVFTSEVGGPQWKMIEDVLSGVGGDGTANYVPKWIDSDTIGDSLIYDDATNVGIGTTNPQRLLHVNGDAIVSGKFYDQTNSTGDKGYVLTSDDNGPLWKASGDFDGLSADLIATGQTLTTDINAVASNLIATGVFVDTNTVGIATNVTAIALNASNLVATGAFVDTNTVGIATNVTAIALNASNLVATGAFVDTNTVGIATNVTAIALNASNLVATGAFVDTNTAGVATNVTNLIATGQFLTNALPVGADPTAVISGAATNGTATTFMRSDAAPALKDTEVTPGSYTYAAITVNAQGRLTAASNGTAPGGGTVTGTGTAGKITKWSGTSAATDSSFLSESATTLTSTSNIIDCTTSNFQLRLSNYGRVGVGTNDATSPFISYLADSSTFGGDNALIRAYNAGNRGAKGHASGSNLFKLDFSDACAMIVNKDGNVGIGTTNPATLLDVRGTVTVGGALLPSANGTHNLGSSSAYWKNAYLEDTAINGTLYVGGVLTAVGNISQTTGDFLYSGGGNWDLKHTIASQNITFYTTPSGGSATERLRITHDGNLSFLNDTSKIKMGLGDDLQIYHDGSNSYINDTGTGALFLKTNYLAVAGANGNQLINAEQGAAVELYHNNAVKLATTSTGVTVTGGVLTDSTVLTSDTFYPLTSGMALGNVAKKWALLATTGNFSGDLRIGNNVPMWSGSYGGALVLKGNDATADRYAQLGIVNSSGTLVYTGLVVDTVGNVGIGITNPSKLLDVNGTAYFRDDIYFGNTVLNIASGFSNQTGMGWDKSQGQLQLAGSNTTTIQVGRHSGTGNIQDWRYESTVKASVDTSGNMSLAGTLTEASSLALKENIEDFTPSLDIINKIRPVKYNKKKESKKEIGLIAEELAELFPELVEKDEQGNPSGVSYSRAVAVLLHGFKELYKEVKELKEKI